MVKPWIVAVFVCVGFVFVSLLFVLFSVRNRQDAVVEQTGEFVEIEDSIEGRFVARHDLLSIVFLALKNPDFESQGRFVFSLLDTGGGVVRQLDFSGQNVQDPSDVRFQFQPIADSAGKEFIVLVKRIGEDGALIGAAVAEDKSLALKAFYRYRGRSQLVHDLLNSWGAKVAEGKLFFGIWILALGGLAWVGRKDRRIG